MDSQTTTANNQQFTAFIEKLKKEKTDEELGKFYADLVKLSTTTVYIAIMSVLTKEEVEQIGQIPDEQEAQKEMTRLFTQKTGMSPNDFVLKLRDEVIKNYPQGISAV